MIGFSKLCLLKGISHGFNESNYDIIFVVKFPKFFP
jgi:hypothetical protein